MRSEDRCASLAYRHCSGTAQLALPPTTVGQHTHTHFGVPSAVVACAMLVAAEPEPLWLPASPLPLPSPSVWCHMFEPSSKPEPLGWAVRVVTPGVTNTVWIVALVTVPLPTCTVHH